MSSSMNAGSSRSGTTHQTPSIPISHQSLNPSAKSIVTTPHQQVKHNNPSNDAPSTSPIQPITPLPAQIASLRGHLKRRRSSFPPDTKPATTNHLNLEQNTASFPFPFSLPINLAGGPINGFNSSAAVLTSQTGFGDQVVGMSGWTAGLGGLLGFGNPNPNGNGNASTAVQGSDPFFDSIFTPGLPMQMDGFSTLKPHLHDISFTPGRIAQSAVDLAWKTILASVVDVEGVGEVGVARVLQEIWKRGGGDAVTNQCLWPSIIISLSFPPSGHSATIPNPSAQASLSLQQLYNLTMRQWEPAIFSGLLAQFANSTTPGPFAQQSVTNTHVNDNSVNQSHVETPFGPGTPSKDLDFGSWTNMTPGTDWSSFVATGNNNDATVYKPSSLANIFEPREDLGERRGSVLIENEDGSGIDELLAQMEEEESQRQFTQHAEAALQDLTPAHTPAVKDTEKQTSGQRNSLAAFPTPETDGSITPSLTNTLSHTTSDGHKQSEIATPEDQACSPYVTANSITSSSTTSTVSRAIPSTRGPRPTSVEMPKSTFIPPPPMCMFFNPAFKDLTAGKLGVWRGDLEVRGRGGGKFSVVVVGEAGTDYLWQSHTWPKGISYPPQDQAAPESCTSSMIPVSHLARDGFTPVSMGMVLCNDADVGPFCAMVQGLHAEGVAFHLPTPSRLPIVLLPAKFDSGDNLQRLGIAYMSKPGVLPAPPPPVISSALSAMHTAKGQGTGYMAGGKKYPGKVASKDESKKKRRRQSAPAKALNIAGAASRALAAASASAIASASGSGSGAASGDSPVESVNGGRKKRASQGLGRVEEEGDEKDVIVIS